MTMRPVKCGGCGERERVRVLEYMPGVRPKVEPRGGGVQLAAGVEPYVRYVCGKCGARSEHGSFPLTPEQLAALGYSG